MSMYLVKTVLKYVLKK